MSTIKKFAELTQLWSTGKLLMILRCLTAEWSCKILNTSKDHNNVAIDFVWISFEFSLLAMTCTNWPVANKPPVYPMETIHIYSCYWRLPLLDVQLVRSTFSSAFVKSWGGVGPLAPLSSSPPEQGGRDLQDADHGLLLRPLGQAAAGEGEHHQLRWANPDELEERERSRRVERTRYRRWGNN